MYLLLKILLAANQSSKVKVFYNPYNLHLDRANQFISGISQNKAVMNKSWFTVYVYIFFFIKISENR